MASSSPGHRYSRRCRRERHDPVAARVGDLLARSRSLEDGVGLGRPDGGREASHGSADRMARGDAAFRRRGGCRRRGGGGVARSSGRSSGSRTSASTRGASHDPAHRVAPTATRSRRYSRMPASASQPARVVWAALALAVVAAHRLLRVEGRRPALVCALRRGDDRGRARRLDALVHAPPPAGRGHAAAAVGGLVRPDPLRCRPRERQRLPVSERRGAGASRPSRSAGSHSRPGTARPLRTTAPISSCWVAFRVGVTRSRPRHPGTARSRERRTTPRRVAERRPRVADADDAAARSSGAADADDEPVDAVLDELRRGIVRTRDDDARDAPRRRLDDDQPVALASGRQEQAQRPRERLLDPLLVTNPGASTTPSSPASAICRSTSGRSGPSPRISPRSSGNDSRASATAGAHGGRPLLRDVASGEDHDRLRGSTRRDVGELAA